MDALRVWGVLAWIALPTVMYSGYSLLQPINKGYVLTPFQVNWFRAGHAHAGVLLLLSLLFYTFLDQTTYSLALKHAACAKRSWSVSGTVGPINVTRGCLDDGTSVRDEGMVAAHPRSGRSERGAAILTREYQCCGTNWDNLEFVEVMAPARDLLVERWEEARGKFLWV